MSKRNLCVSAGHLQNCTPLVSNQELLSSPLVSLHARKASGEDVGDSVLGSTGIRGSLSTLLHFHHYRKEKIYTVLSDQTVRAEAFGELDETIVNRDPATGIISLGAKYEDVKVQDKKDEWTLRRSKILGFVKNNSGRTADAIATALNMSKKTVLPILEKLEESRDIRLSGAGVKGDPQLYFGDVIICKVPVAEPSPASVTPQAPIITWDQLPICKGCGINKVAGEAFNADWGVDFCSPVCWGQGVV